MKKETIVDNSKYQKGKGGLIFSEEKAMIGNLNNTNKEVIAPLSKLKEILESSTTKNTPIQFFTMENRDRRIRSLINNKVVRNERDTILFFDDNNQLSFIEFTYYLKREQNTYLQVDEIYDYCLETVNEPKYKCKAQLIKTITHHIAMDVELVRCYLRAM